MNNLYVFAIGGSGERVMKSLVMALAAGMPMGAKKVIPVFVDNDVKSNALTTCLDLIKYYRADPEHDSPNNGEAGLHYLCKKANQNGKVPSFAHVEIGEPVILNVAGAQIGTLDAIIGSLNKNDAIERCIDEEKKLLFTDDDLAMPLTVGFVGNPNVGSVVLNSLSLHSDGFTTILGNAGPNDGVFVIGSLFGGTGAAGFPLIINKIDEAPINPLLGGVAVLPYFNIQQGNQITGLIDTSRYDVNSDTFSAKTRAALMYYDEYMRNMHYMYYVGDNGNRTQYQHYVGGAKQRNPYNLIELMAAMTIVNFSNQDVVNKPKQVVYKMPLWEFDNAGMLSNLKTIPNKDLKRAVVKFQMMKELFENNGDGFLKWAIANDSQYVRDVKFDRPKLDAVREENNGNLYQMAWALRHIFHEWDIWMSELSERGQRKLRIFDRNNVTIDNLAQKFFTDSNYGIAKTETVWRGPFFKRRQETEIVPTNIANALLKSFRDFRFSAADAREGDALGKVLLIISNALDDVIDNNCAL